MKYLIGYIDEQDEDLEIFRNEMQDEFDIFGISPLSNLDDTVEIIFNEKFDGLIIDYKLYGSDPEIKYDGVELASKIFEIKEAFPIMLLTRYKVDAIEQLFDPLRVFEKSLLSQANSVTDFKINIQRQILYYQKVTNEYKNELIKLIEKQNINGDLSLKELDRVNELDKILTRRLFKPYEIPKIISTKVNELSDLVKRANELIERLKTENE